jgi:multiple sugar transport system permease protein
MPIISAIGRKHWKVRFLFLGMYAFLVVGAATMVYPFLLMLSGSTKSAMDIKFFDAFPRFMRDRDWMYAKHLEGLFNERILNLQTAYDTDDVAFEKLCSPDTKLVESILDDWQEKGAGADAKQEEKLDREFRNMTIPAMVPREEFAAGWHQFLAAYGGPVDGTTASFALAMEAFLASSECPTGEPNRDLARELQTFLNEEEIPFYASAPGYLEAPNSKTFPSSLRGFKELLAAKHGKSIDDVNRTLGTEFVGWNSVYVIAPSCLQRRDQPELDQFGLDLREYCAKSVPAGLSYLFSPEGFFKKQVLKNDYSTDIEKYNAKHGTDYASYREVHLARFYPADAPELERTDWEKFVRQTVALEWVHVAPEAEQEFREFLEHKHGSIGVVNRLYGTDYASFGDIPLFAAPPSSGMQRTDWDAFVTGWTNPVSGEEAAVSLAHLSVQSVEFRFQDWLLARHGGTVAGVNADLGTNYRSPADILLPQRDLHAAYFLDNIAPLRWEFVTRNYRTVVEYLLFHGRGIFNTVVYCTLAILSALLVNPLAAYAMSRYRMPSTYKILLFLMCTMAFPPMVTSIPNFLMLRKLGLLNTFAALILPGMANGYSIFLLKGFFDAQPQELYESAQLDGASEWTLFWQITMALSKPILAVIALRAFTMAYSNFMFAFVTCQDEKMWTLMVWLYQLQQRSGQAVMYASLIIAAVPTFLIFLFCQNIIMRGIVVPSEK